MAGPLATDDVRPCAIGPGQSMPWVASLFARYKVDLDKIVRFRARKARKKAVTVKYAG